MILPHTHYTRYRLRTGSRSDRYVYMVWLVSRTFGSVPHPGCQFYPRYRVCYFWFHYHIYTHGYPRLTLRSPVGPHTVPFVAHLAVAVPYGYLDRLGFYYVRFTGPPFTGLHTRLVLIYVTTTAHVPTPHRFYVCWFPRYTPFCSCRYHLYIALLLPRLVDYPDYRMRLHTVTLVCLPLPGPWLVGSVYRTGSGSPLRLFLRSTVIITHHGLPRLPHTRTHRYLPTTTVTFYLTPRTHAHTHLYLPPFPTPHTLPHGSHFLRLIWLHHGFSHRSPDSLRFTFVFGSRLRVWLDYRFTLPVVILGLIPHHFYAGW